MKKWIRSSNNPQSQNRPGFVFVGVAELKKGSDSSFNYWESCGRGEEDTLSLPPAHPIVVSTARFPVGTRLEIYLPKGTEINEPEEVSDVHS